MVRLVHCLARMATTESVVQKSPAGPDTTDRRALRRVPLKSPVLVDTRSTWHRARGADVSVGGVSVECEGPLPVGKTVDLYFELPTGVAVETEARVIRSIGDSAALAFLHLDRRSEIALRVHCRLAELGRQPVRA